MLIFIIPLRSPEASSDWEHVSRLATRSLRSVCRQDCDDFRVVLVCNRRPKGDYSHPAITIIEDDFPVPGNEPEERMRDKGRKIKRGLIETRGMAPAHYMYMDADDCVHRGLASLSKREPECPGWAFKVGYIRDERNQWLYRWPDFNLYCGTSSIIRFSLDDLPTGMSDPENADSLFGKSHTKIETFMRDRGTPLVPLPFVGTVYNTDTGENHTQIVLRNWRGKRMFLKKLFTLRPLTAAKREEFGLYELE